MSFSLYKASLFQNAIINGNFAIAQRGTSFVRGHDTGGAYILDRWAISVSNIDEFHATFSQSTDVPTGSRSYYSLKVEVTTPESALATNELLEIYQPIEGYNIAPYINRRISISFWIKCSITGTYTVSLSNNAATRSYISEITISSANTWEYKTINNILMNETTGFNYTTGVGLYLAFWVSAGSDYQSSSLNSWITTGKYVSSNQTNTFLTTNGATFYLAEVQLNEGSVALPFQPRHYSEELALCQRYFWRISNPGSQYNDICVGVATGTGTAYSYGTMPVPMRVAPSAFDISAVTHFATMRSNSSTDATSNIVLASSSTTRFGLLTTSANLVAGNATVVYLYNGASSCYFGFSAEL
jgi:hypothetical protein